ncbi:hypothetical protein ABFS82_09G053000 [Erythranthe guttata]|uniref:egg cell-secreted protein 1.2-like n=1 Tax=Erythranthe guttata TaxID=4155 RepID=UPI00064DEC31|nr:PREDICTED: egg cell-secreted protein 1.2-like [Erythranthe guttata]|eukprot:XP_012827655.1 PREDICTED: egg cell-secreted protein 1.2-like [Erythranthe guttata]
MASAANGVVFFLTLTSLTLSSYSAGRETPIQPPTNADEPGWGPLGINGSGPLDCLTALYKIKSCTKEILEYFATGAIDISPPCCEAISVITHKCWPSFLGTLGFSQDQTYILRGYCDAIAAAAYTTMSGSIPSPVVGPSTGPLEPVSSPVGQPALSPAN